MYDPRSALTEDNVDGIEGAVGCCVGWERELVDAGRLEWSGGVPLVPHCAEE